MDSVGYQKIKKKREVENQKDVLRSFLYSRGVKRDKFFTNDSHLYFDCGDCETKKTIDFRAKNKLIDSLNNKALNDYRRFGGEKDDFLWIKYKQAVSGLSALQDNFQQGKESFLGKTSLIRLWNTSILAAVIIGMISMSFIYRYLGQGAAAGDVNKEKVGTEIVTENKKPEVVESKKDDYILELSEYLKEEDNKKFNEKVQELVEGYPIEDFLPYLQGKDREVVSFYIAIAKKESNWGKRVPVLKGEDCYNYVGYRGKRDRMGTGGHTCFDDRKEAVDVVSKRIEALIKDYGRDTAEEMVVWKCGNNCAATGGQAAANKWISDVKGILKELNN
jgi:hypothetical protein